MGEFPPPPPPFSEHPSFFFPYPSNIDWFYYIITKIHPQFQNPGSAPALGSRANYTFYPIIVTFGQVTLKFTLPWASLSLLSFSFSWQKTRLNLHPSGK